MSSGLVSAPNSTNVRSPEAAAPRERLLRLGFRWLQAAAPAAAALLAERLFFTTARPALSPRLAALLASGRRFGVGFRGRELAAWSWGAGPAVILVHGWSSRGGHLGAFVEPLVASGRSVIAFDAPAHGATPGRATTIPEMAAALREVARFELDGLIAHSIGGPAVTLALLGGLSVRRLVFLAPASDPWLFTERFGERLSLRPDTLRRLRQRAERRAGLRYEELHVAALAPRLRVPLLVVHDRDDDEVPWSQGAAIAQAWPAARLLSTEGLGHRRILRDPVVVTRAVAFLAGEG